MMVQYRICGRLKVKQQYVIGKLTNILYIYKRYLATESYIMTML